MTNPRVLKVQAEFVVAPDASVYRPGHVVIDRGQLVQVSRGVADDADFVLDNQVLLPGFVNAHTHLEFSDLKQPFPATGTFPDWIRSVVSHRQREATEQTPEELLQSRRNAISTGLREAFESGTVLIGDIVTRPWDILHARFCADVLAARLGAADLAHADQLHRLKYHLLNFANPTLFPFLEIIGLQTQRLHDSIEWAANIHREFGNQLGFAEMGISPHAPYSLAAGALESISRRFDRATPVAMHVAESLEEREWLSSGTGPFATAFQQMGLEPIHERIQISSAIDLLQHPARALLIHGNYLTPDEMDRLSHMANISVVYCPRTHQHFQHAPYPLGELHSRGIRVCLGTDSRASSPDLNVWRELVAARHAHQALSAKDALRMITQLPAQALGLDSRFGSIEPSKDACINVASLTALHRKSDLLEEITSDANLRIRPLALELLSACDHPG